MDHAELLQLAEIIHQLTYVVPGKIVSFSAEFKNCVADVMLSPEGVYETRYIFSKEKKKHVEVPAPTKTVMCSECGFEINADSVGYTPCNGGCWAPVTT